MGFWAVLLIEIGLTLLWEWIRPKPKFDDPQPSSLGDFNLPTALEGRPIPILWGTCKIPGPNVLWYGDLDARAITKNQKTGLFSSEDVTIGYQYFLGLQYGLCAGEIDTIAGVFFDDKVAEFSGVDMGEFARLTFDLPDFFGGENQEGGISGEMDIYYGSRTQLPNDYLEAKLGEDLPAYRGLCYAVLRQMYLGNSPYLKPIAFAFRRTPNGINLTGDKHNVFGDANPACMIYEILTNPPSQNGLGISPGLIDVENFKEVGGTLFWEGLGLSMLVDSSTSGGQLIQEILRHIDGVLFTDPETGLLTLKLARMDYLPSYLTILDDDTVDQLTLSRPDWSETRNVVKIKYIDRADGFVEKVAQAQELASIDLRSGEVAMEEIPFLGISNAAQAQAIAARSLKTLAYPLAVISFRAKRKAWSFRPGTPFRLQYSPLGIADMVCRVTRISYGTLTDGWITIDAAEDIFAVAWTGYSPPSPSGWTNPSGDVPAVLAQGAMAAPWEAVKSLSPPPSVAHRAIGVAMRGSPGITGGFNLYTDVPGASWSWPQKLHQSTPTAVLASGLSRTDTEIVIQDGKDLDRVHTIGSAEFGAGQNIAVLGAGELSVMEEWIAFQTVTDNHDGTFTLSGLARGCLDTIPGAWDPGSRIWIVSHGFGLVDIAGPVYPALGRNGKLRVQPFNNNGVRDFSLCQDSLARIDAVDRALLANLPTRIQINGAAFPSSVSGDLVFSWRHRNRLGSWSWSTSGETDEIEPSSRYFLYIQGKIGGPGGGTKEVHFEITTEGYTYPESQELIDFGWINTHLLVMVITLSNGSENSWTYFLHEFDRIP